MRYQELKTLLHGGDYNPEQWLDRPDILAEDIRLMKKAGVNVVTLGVFSWSTYEPREGEFHFEWLDGIMDSLYENGIYVILATPSGGKPPWMIRKYPEIMRTRADRVRLLYGDRENQCNSSRVFREKVRKIDSLLAERYAHHPALLMWHISNELNGECHCPDCQKNFQEWLRRKYGAIDRLNREYWSAFWSHGYSDFAEIESPAPQGDGAMHALSLDYKRFYSELSIDLVREEIDTVKKYNPEIPATTNLFYFNCGIDLARLSEILDVVSWDSYPRWHCGNDWGAAVKAAFDFDFCRAQKKKPFLLMESTPSTTNHFEDCKLKRPGMHLLSSLQAVACGADSVQYFQWRKGRGAFEKYHGAVLSHNGSGDTRVFRDVAEVGGRLAELSRIKGTGVKSRVAVIYDWENMRALEEQKSLHSRKRQFEGVVMDHYEALLRNYISVDVIDSRADFAGYDLIVGPVLYLMSGELAGRIRDFVERGGAFVTTFYSGLVNENDLAWEGWPPCGLNDVFGIRVEETDALCEGEWNELRYAGETYKAFYACDLIHGDGAEVLSVFEKDFYKGMPALTRSRFGAGAGYYVAGRVEKELLYRLYGDILRDRNIGRIVESEYVDQVMVKERCDGDGRYVFLMNFAEEGRSIAGHELAGYEVKILRKTGC